MPTLRAGAPTGGMPDAESWTVLHRFIHKWAQPVIEAALAETHHDKHKAEQNLAGCVVAAAGAPGGPWHCDGWEPMFNVFCPLVPVTRENGPTQFHAGSHTSIDDEQSLTDCTDEDIEAMSDMVAPEVCTGELLLFDYRVEHRGTANMSGSPRPIAYLSYAPEGETGDQHNFPAGASLLDEHRLDALDEWYAYRDGSPPRKRARGVPAKKR